MSGTLFSMRHCLALFLLFVACTNSESAHRQPAAAVQTPIYRVSSAREHNPFAKIQPPYPGSAWVMGSYSAGCLQGAIPLPKSAPGFEVVRLARHRYFAHPLLAELLLRAGVALQADATMLFGDLAQARGGPMPGGHVSHQTGLDADIWFYYWPAGRHFPEENREKLYGASVLKGNLTELNPKKWHDVYDRQLMWFAGQPETDRIFVNAAIKKHLCRRYPGDSRLAKLRPWYAHNDHFHLRLKCPVDQPLCVGQKPVTDIECEEKDLAFWFSDEVLNKVRQSQPSPPFEAELPQVCRAIL